MDILPGMNSDGQEQADISHPMPMSTDAGEESKPPCLPSTPDKFLPFLRSERGSRAQGSSTTMSLFGTHSFSQPPSDPLHPSVSSFERRIHVLSYNASDEIELNVGGTVFKTTRSTLSKDEKSMLTALVRNQPHNFTGTLFIDRDGVRFRDILNYLRVGTVHLEDSVSLHELLDEAEFFSLSALQGLCLEKLSLIEARVAHRQEEKAKQLNDALQEVASAVCTQLAPWLEGGSDDRHGKSRRVGQLSSDHVFTMDDDF